MNKYDDISRFKEAQKLYYKIALSEINNGKKESHWIWFIFPQISGLGYSPTAEYYAIKDLDEAKEYWNDQLLHDHLVEISKALLKLDNDIVEILGHVDSLKVKSCATLFYIISKHDIFKSIIDKFYNGQWDAYTIQKTGGSVE